MSDFTPAVPGTDQVLSARDGGLGRLRLNRPEAINALTHPMITALWEQLHRWADDGQVTAVCLDGAGERGLCAGGDIRALRAAITSGRETEAAQFWDAEYRLNALIARYPKPYVAVMDGVCMGGGVGISAHGSIRLVTERSTVAMPETGIGFFPDVGALHLLSRSPGELGTHVALTGLPVSGADAVTLGLADVVVASSALPDLVAGMPQGRLPDVAELRACDPERQAGGLAGRRGWIDECYAGADPVAIVERLEVHGDPEARRAAEVLRTRSPLSVALTLEALRRAAGLTLEQVLTQDRTLGRAIVHGSDFLEGVRTVLVDRGDAPRWRYPSLEDVPRAEVRAAFDGPR